MSLTLSHLRALYTGIVIRSGGPDSIQATEFRERLGGDREFQRQAQIVGELYRMGLLRNKAGVTQPRSQQPEYA